MSRVHSLEYESTWGHMSPFLISQGPTQDETMEPQSVTGSGMPKQYHFCEISSFFKVCSSTRISLSVNLGILHI